jgi:uncharacterized protein YxjI
MTAQAATPAAGDMTVKDGADKAVLVLKKTAAGYDVSDAKGKIGALEIAGGKMTLRDAKGAKAGSLKKDGDEWKLDDAAGKTVVKLKPKDGGYRLKDASDQFLLKMKPRDDGFKLGDDAGKSLGKVKVKEDRVKIMDDADKTLFSMKGSLKAPALMGVLIVKQLTPLQKAAFLAGGGL